jgi:predicted PurR-regulated permease PerM
MKTTIKVIFFSALGALVVYLISKFLKDRQQTSQWMNSHINVTQSDIDDLDNIWKERLKSIPKDLPKLLK